MQFVNTEAHAAPKPSTTTPTPTSTTAARPVVPGPDRGGRRPGGGFPFPFRRGSGYSIEKFAAGGRRRKRDQFRVDDAHCRAGRDGCR